MRKGVAVQEPQLSTRRMLMKRATTAVRQLAAREAAKKQNRLSSRVREALLTQAPLLVNGIWKQSGDVVRPWFKLVNPETNVRHSKDKEFQAWCRAHKLQMKTRDFLVDAHLHGDGYAEYEFDDSGQSDADVGDEATQLDVHRIDPVGVDLELRNDGRYDLVQRIFADTIRLSPDRFGTFENRTLAGHVHGLSTVEVAFHIGKSNVQGDQTIGEILFHSGIPREHWTINKPGPGEIEDLQEQILDPTFERAMVTDAETQSKVLNPAGIPPKDYLEWIKISYAAAIGMPVMMLEGAQAGAVVGSETNIQDYQSTLSMIEHLVLEPEMERIVDGVLGLSSDEYDIMWNPFPILPSLDASIRLTKANAFNLLKNAGLTIEAAAREAGIQIDPKKDIADLLEPEDGQLRPDAAVDGDVDEDDEDTPEPEEEAPASTGRNGAKRR